MSTTDDTTRAWFERVWAHREEEVYPSLFGAESKGIYPLNAEILTGTFKQESIDPRWLHYGVFQFSGRARLAAAILLWLAGQIARRAGL